jgi:iron-sulfur cluster insertion protein
MVTITNRAAEKFKEMSSNSVLLPRIEIIAGGCNGFEKKFSFASKQDDDIEITLPNGIRILIDNFSYEMLDKSIVDYKATLTGNFFSIEIPEAVSQCGCGSSFSL